MAIVSDPNPSQSDAPSTDISVEEAAQKPKSHFWIDFGPLLIFFVTFHWLRRDNPDDALFIAAAIFAVAALIALALGWLKYRTLSFVLILSTILIVGTTALAFFFDNKLFLFMRPTVVNGLLGLGVLGGVVFGKNVLKVLLGDAFTLPAKAWNTLAIRWGIFFLCVAAINEVVWRTQTEAFWVNFKTFGFMPLTLIFTLAQIPFIQKHGGLKGLEK
jgi:intracellular septation protein